MFRTNKSEQIYVAEEKLGGIQANDTYSANFIYVNMMIVTNLIHESWRISVQILLFLGSSYTLARSRPTDGGTHTFDRETGAYQ